MLARAEERLAPHRARITLVEGSFFDPLPACDAAVASLALHHVRTLDEKIAIYRNVHRALGPGGVLLDADASIPAAPPLAERTWRRWAAHLVAHGDTEARGPCPVRRLGEGGRYFGIDEELSALRAAGFAFAEVDFPAGPARVIASIR